MLKIEVTLVPFGDESRKRVLETLVIYNTGTHKDRPRKGHYVVVHGGEHVHIGDFDRHKNALELVEVAIELLRESGCLKSAGQLEEQITHSTEL